MTDSECGRLLIVNEIIDARLKHWGSQSKGISCDALAAHFSSLANTVSDQLAAGAVVRVSIVELGALCLFLMEAEDA